MGLLSQDMVDQYDPALMFTIPRLAIVCGLFMFPHGPLSLTSPTEMSEMFRPFWVSIDFFVISFHLRLIALFKSFQNLCAIYFSHSLFTLQSVIIYTMLYAMYKALGKKMILKISAIYYV